MATVPISVTVAAVLRGASVVRSRWAVRAVAPAYTPSAAGTDHRRWASTTTERAAVHGDSTIGATADPCRSASRAAPVP